VKQELPAQALLAQWVSLASRVKLVPQHEGLVQLKV
jgi:hypothetical protein